jgi:hypothetical protein
VNIAFFTLNGLSVFSLNLSLIFPGGMSTCKNIFGLISKQNCLVRLRRKNNEYNFASSLYVDLVYQKSGKEFEYFTAINCLYLCILFH